jgi:hypothetical protein
LPRAYFGLQTILTFVGNLTDMNSDAGDTDMPFEIFTLRNLINFFLDLAGQFP